MKNIGEGKNFITVKDAARILGTSMTTMYDLAKRPVEKGGPPTRRFGRNIIRFPRNKFMAWAEGSKI